MIVGLVKAGFGRSDPHRLGSRIAHSPYATFQIKLAERHLGRRGLFSALKRFIGLVQVRASRSHPNNTNQYLC
jgi:hypothetical protein